MKIKITILIVLLTPALNLFAQSDSARHYLDLGLKAQTERRYAVAEKNFNKSLQFDSSSADTRFALAAVYYEMRKYNNALQQYQLVYNRDNNNREAIAKLGELNYNLHRWNDAIKFTKLAQQLNAGSRHNYILGKAFYELEDYGQSVEYLGKASREDPANAEAPYLIGRAFVEMSNYKMAIPYMEKAINIDTTKYSWVYELALVYSAVPDDKSAIRYMELAAERGYKTDNDYYENLSYCYLNTGQIDKAIEKLKAVLEKKPADLTILYAVAEAYYIKGKYKEAIDYWDQVLFFDKQNSKSLYMIGMAYQKKGEKQKGIALCDKAIEMDPSLGVNKHQRNMSMGL
jgi:tetratricopeptide (TPR) repeat protein